MEGSGDNTNGRVEMRVEGRQDLDAGVAARSDRLARNRESAKRCRTRKKEGIERMRRENCILREENSILREENRNLKGRVEELEATQAGTQLAPSLGEFDSPQRANLVGQVDALMEGKRSPISDSSAEGASVVALPWMQFFREEESFFASVDFE